MSTLPIISLAAFDQNDRSEQEIQKLYNACDECGFFYLTDHGIDPEVVQRAIDTSRTFFNLPEEVKSQYGQNVQTVFPQTSRGFVPMYGETLHEEDGADPKELFDLGFECASSDKPFTGPTVLPDNTVAPGFAAAHFEIQNEIMNNVTPRLLQALARALGQAPTYFDPYFTEPILIQRVIHYPGSYSSAGRHTDNGIFTVLIQEQLPVPSLYVHSKNEWIEAPYVEDTFVVNLGDMLQHWTNGIFASTPHQVNHNQPESRISIPFFVYPDIDAVFAPLQSDEQISVQEIMLKNFESIWVTGEGAGRAQELV